MVKRFLMMAVLMSAVPVAAQELANRETDDSKQRRPTALSIRQQRVNRMMQSLERLFLTMAQTLEKTEPERAERLVKAFQQSKELLIERRMQEIVRLLDLTKLNNASEEQDKLLVDLRKLVATLLDDDIDADKLREEMERLKRWRDIIQKLAKEEKQQKRQTDKVANKDKSLADLERQIKAVEKLIQREQKLVDKTSKADAKDSQGLDSLSTEQQGIRTDTESLANEIAGKIGQTGDNPSSQTAADGGSQDGEQSGSQGNSQNSNQDGSQADSQGGSQNGFQSGQQSDSQNSEPGEQPLRKAADHQESAEENLKKQKPKTAQGNEEKSVDELKKALDELKRERDRLESLSKKDFDQMADKQDRTADKTDQLNQEMAKASQSGGSQSSSSNSGGQQPGQQSVANACQCMQQASGNLKNQQAGNASPQQQKAIDELNKALDEIQGRLAELQDQLDDEKLVRLEDIFLQMLERQQQASAGTIDLDRKKKETQGKLRRADRLALKKLAVEERELALMAQQALDLLIEDGTSIVFPKVVEDLRDILNTVGKLLDEQRTDDYTRTLQKEVETTLEELIEALQKAMKSGGGGGGGGGGNCPPPLLPNTAELKLLRALQLRVNRRTKSFDKARPEGELDEVMKSEIAKITALQAEIANMVKQILDRN